MRFPKRATFCRTDSPPDVLFYHQHTLSQPVSAPSSGAYAKRFLRYVLLYPAVFVGFLLLSPLSRESINILVAWETQAALLSPWHSQPRTEIDACPLRLTLSRPRSIFGRLYPSTRRSLVLCENQTLHWGWFHFACVLSWSKSDWLPYWVKEQGIKRAILQRPLI